MTKKKETDYELLYHELLEKYDEMFDNLTQQVVDAYDENDVLKDSNETMKKEIAKLRQTIGGYTTQLTRTKKELVNIRADHELAKKSVSDLTKVSLENKAMVKECIKREQEMEENYKEQMRELDHQIIKLTEDVSEQKQLTYEAERERLFYKENYEFYIKLPWFKRLFVK